MILDENEVLLKTIQGGEKESTNNRMEYAAALCALREIPDDADVTIHTDSMLLVQTMEQWADKWVRTNKLKSKKNANLIEKILAERSRIARVKFSWIPSHSGVPLNEKCDLMANEAREKTVRHSGAKWIEIH